MESLDLLTPKHLDFPVKAREHQADAHLLIRRDGEIQARCSLWWRATPIHDGQTIGAIGHYESTDNSAAVTLLDAALTILRENGTALAVGPLDGNTWRRYRFITGPGNEPPFFLEPVNPPEYPVQWQTAGFTPLAEYFSSLCDDLTVVDPRLERVAQRLAEIIIRPLDPARYVQELDAIYQVSTVSFVENFLYTPLRRDEFIAQYLPLRDLLDPRLVLLAECEGQPVGYIFALPDFAQKQRGQPLDTVILKTAACLPGRRFAGLGSLLVGRLHDTARRLGWQRIIHALMHESNNSRNLSGLYATTMRRYTLFARRLTP